jgi:hypothetical protein
MKSASIASITIAIATALMLAACSSNKQSPTEGLASMKISPAPPGACEIDAAKMCASIGGLSGGGLAAGSASTSPSPAQTGYSASTAPESLEFQIPAGQAIKLTCYFNQAHTSVVRADAAAESALTDNSVAYMKTQGFCAQK